MSDNPLADVADRFTTELVNLYGATAGTSIAYLPGGIPVPDYFVQNGIVNVTQVSEWLHGTFDAPLLVDGPGDVAVSILPPGYGSAMYERAVLGAQPIGVPDSDVRSQVNGLIASARADFGAPGAAKIIECLPQDWPAADNDDYWASFDSSVATSTSTTTTVNGTPPTRFKVPIRINPTLWQLREVAPVVAEASPVPTDPPPVREGPLRFDQVRLRALSVEQSPQLLQRANQTTVAPSLLARSAGVTAAPMLMKRSTLADSAAFTRVDRTGVFSDDSPVQRLHQFEPIGIYGPGRVVQEVTTTATSSSLVVTLSHTCVTLTRAFGGVTWWDDIFLRDQRWYLPGEPSGALLPPAAPLADDTSGDGTGDTTDTPATAPILARSYAIPVGLVLVRNLAVTGTWSNDASTVLSSSTGLLGPFNLAGAHLSQSADGQSTYLRPGMQVVAVLYASLPVLPPSPDPQLVPPVVVADPVPDTTSANPTDPSTDVPPTEATDSTGTATDPPPADPPPADPVSDDPTPATDSSDSSATALTS